MNEPRFLDNKQNDLWLLVPDANRSITSQRKPSIESSYSSILLVVKPGAKSTISQSDSMSAGTHPFFLGDHLSANSRKQP